MQISDLGPRLGESRHKVTASISLLFEDKHLAERIEYSSNHHGKENGSDCRITLYTSEPVYENGLREDGLGVQSSI